MGLLDAELYAEAAYGTPWEPFIRGDIAYRHDGPIPRDVNRIRWPSAMVDMFPSLNPTEPTDGLPKLAEPTPDSQHRAMEIFRRSLHDPILAWGADNPGRLSMNQPGTEWKTGGRIANGLYLDGADVAYATGGNPRVDWHELYHRGLSRLGEPPQRHHGLIGAADHYDKKSGTPFGSMYGYGTTADDLERYKQLQDVAQSAWAARRPMGPR